MNYFELCNRARVVRDRKGASTIELALVLPIFGLLILGLVDVATGFGKQLALEQAASRTMQQAVVQGASLDNYDYLKQAGADASGEPLQNVSLTKWLECDGIRQLSFDGDCVGTQVIARRVRIGITSFYTPPFDYGNVPGLSTTPGLTATKLTGTAQVRVQ